MNFGEFFKPATGNRVSSEKDASIASLSESNVARRNIEQINSEFLECVENLPDFAPAGFEFVSHICLPVVPYIRWKFGTGVKVCAGEIQDEWPFDDGHFDDSRVIVESYQLRNIEAENTGDSQAPQSFINL